MEADLLEEAETVRTVTELTAEYRRRFAEKKREKNILDFSDLEHFALEMLWEKQPDGTRKRSSLAEEYRSELKEIYVDEYQDSNEVQEQLLKAITGKEQFLVGDVKQSIPSTASGSRSRSCFWRNTGLTGRTIFQVIRCRRAVTPGWTCRGISEADMRSLTQ